MKNKNYTKHFIFLSVLLVVLFVINISLGSVSIPFKELLNTLIGASSSKESWQTIIIDFRLPKAITAILVGSGLSISGLLMQTLFRNPLAGPFVLGISSGASLGVAIFILGTSFFGGFLILIIGLMFGSLTSAIISVLAYFSDADQIQQYLFWSFGSLGNLTWNELTVFTILYAIGIVGTIAVIKPLNSFMLGENYAKSLGVNIKKNRNLILVITSILTGVITAFSGPIAFVGLAVPHIARMIFTSSNHKILIPAVSILGAIVLLICDSIAQLPSSEFTLPINAVTSLFGAPVVIWLLIRKKRIFI